MADNLIKFGHGNYDDIDGVIASGVLDGKDIVITKDTLELIYITEDKQKQRIGLRTHVFDSTEAAKEALKTASDTYVGQCVSIKGEDGKYRSYVVQSKDDDIVVEPAEGNSVGSFKWEEF